MGEEDTRNQLIDPWLEDWDWKVVPFRPGATLDQYNRCAIEEYPTQNGPADYALCVGGRIIGVIEAKRLALGPQEVLKQAERYSQGVAGSPFDFDGFKVPFLYSTNGEIIWFHDVRHPLNRSRTIAHFHTPEALQMAGKVGEIRING